MQPLVERYRDELNPGQVLASFAMVRPFLDGKRVLDLGCASGGYLGLLGRRALGIDASRPNLDACRRKGLSVLGADLARRLPLRDASCEAILLSHVLEHVHSPLDLLGECRRVLQPSGTLVLGLPLESSLVRHVGDHYFSDHPGHVWAFTEEGARALLTHAGYSTEAVFHEPILALKDPTGTWPRLAQRLPEPLKRRVCSAYWIVAESA